MRVVLGVCCSVSGILLFCGLRTLGGGGLTSPAFAKASSYLVSGIWRVCVFVGGILYNHVRGSQSHILYVLS